MRRILLSFLLATGLVLVPAGTATAAPVTVDCDAGDSLQAAVASGAILEVFGTCNEQIVLNAPVTIIGGGPGVTIDATGTGAGNTVTINSDGVTLRRLTITGASGTSDTTGHGVYVSADYAFGLIRVTVEDNAKDGVNMVNSYGTVAASRIRDNGRMGMFLYGGCCGVLNLDGSILARNGSTGVYGEEDQALVISNSYIQDNGGGGVGVYEVLYMVGTVVRRNDGGGISGGTGRGFVRSSRIYNNGGDGIWAIAEVHDSRVMLNAGAGIRGTGTVTGSLVARNNGVGIDCSMWNTCRITDSAIRGNSDTGVVFDGIFPDTMHITGSEIAFNTTSDDAPGAIDVIGGKLVMTNTTVRRNTSASGAAIRSAGIADISFTTIFRNSGPGGVFDNNGAAFGTQFGSSIIYGHTGAADNCTGNAVTTNGYNVIDAFGCPGVATDFNGPPLLTKIAYNGGPTLNHLPSATSPALDRVPAALCKLTVDQRGAPRPAGTACDSGSVERQ